MMGNAGKGQQGMEIRLLIPEDAQDLAAIRLEALEQEPEAFGASLEEEQKKSLEDWQARLAISNQQESGYFGAFAAGELIGIIGYFRLKGAKLRHKALIVSMYVRKVNRGTGIAGELMRATLAHLQSFGDIDQAQLAVVTSNQAAVRFYEKMGFQPYAHEKRALKIGDTYLDETHMYKLFS
jgi:RimJ/RimL family protein N-acetyltransferase